jgi:hypothetical protein
MTIQSRDWFVIFITHTATSSSSQALSSAFAGMKPNLSNSLVRLKWISVLTYVVSSCVSVCTYCLARSLLCARQSLTLPEAKLAH